MVLKPTSDYVDLLKNSLKNLDPNNLIKDIELEKEENIYLVGMGKAAPGLCQALEEKFNFQESLVLSKELGGHPFMNQGSFTNGKRLRDFLNRLPKDAHLVVALTGGASALVEWSHPYFQTSLIKKEMFLEMQKAIVLSGKNIEEMNKLRKSLSVLKNGGLVSEFLKGNSSRSLETLAICDIPEKNLSDIGSGPTAYSTLSIDELKKLAEDVFSPEQKDVYLEFLAQHQNDFLREIDHIPFKLLADYSFMAKKIKSEIEDIFIVLDPLNAPLDEGFTELLETKRGEVIFSGGELPVKVPSDSQGKGGRNQHFVVKFAKEVFFDNKFQLKEEQLKSCFCISLGSDGIDGNTEMAGAWFDYERFHLAQQLGLEPNYYLEEYDSFSFLDKVHAHIKTGPSDTNIMDLRITHLSKT